MISNLHFSKNINRFQKVKTILRQNILKQYQVSSVWTSLSGEHCVGKELSKSLSGEHCVGKKQSTSLSGKCCVGKALTLVVVCGDANRGLHVAAFFVRGGVARAGHFAWESRFIWNNHQPCVLLSSSCQMFPQSKELNSKPAFILLVLLASLYS